MLVSVVVGLLFLSLVTTAVSLFLIVKLRLAPGSESITFNGHGDIIFNGQTDLDRVHLHNNMLRGDQPGSWLTVS